MTTFEWDEKKAAASLSKHGVSFEEAQTVFEDPLARVRPDPDHSEDEGRDVIVGSALAGRLLLVSFTRRRDLNRLISARELTPRERKAYEETATS
jgi:uncharacterized protein